MLFDHSSRCKYSWNIIFYLLLNEEFVLLDTFTMIGAGPFNGGNRFCFSLLSREVDVTLDFGSFATFPFIFTPSFPFLLQRKHLRNIWFRRISFIQRWYCTMVFISRLKAFTWRILNHTGSQLYHSCS